MERADVFILYPAGRVSDVQRRMMTTLEDANIHTLEIDGTFDDCQAIVKTMFANPSFRETSSLSGVNSINWARIVPQIAYYFYAAANLGAPYRPISFSVPTGNFGDIFAGYIAKKMGLPIADLIVATNRNDILHRTLQTGASTKEGVEHTISPSMDIQVSSNFERALFDAYGRDGGAVAQLMEELKAGGFDVSQGAMQALQDHFDSGRASETETSETITRALTETGELLCPHSAVGVHVAASHIEAGTPMVTLATAHPA